MIKTGKPFVGFQLIPFAGHNLASDALDIKRLLDGGQRFGLHPDCGNMIIPSRMLSKQSQMNAERGGLGCRLPHLLNLFKDITHSGIPKALANCNYCLGQAASLGRLWRASASRISNVKLPFSFCFESSTGTTKRQMEPFAFRSAPYS